MRRQLCQRGTCRAAPKVGPAAGPTWTNGDAVLAPGVPFHIHFSDIAYANRNETKHLPYGEGTLRVEPLGKALKKFERPATVITESPDERSHQAIREELYAAVGTRSASRASSSSAPASRSSARKNPA